MDMHSIIVSSISDEPLFTAEQVRPGRPRCFTQRESTLILVLVPTARPYSGGMLTTLRLSQHLRLFRG